MRWFVVVLLVVGMAACTSEGTEVTGSSSDQSSTTGPTLTTSIDDVSTTVALASTSTSSTMDVPMPETVVGEVTSRWMADTETRWDGAIWIDGGPNSHTSPGLFIFEDGRARVVYTQGGEGGSPGLDRTSIRMATCLDATCTAVEIVELIESLDPAYMYVGGDEGDAHGFWVGFDANGTPALVWTGEVDEDPDDGMVEFVGELVLCNDPECAQVTRTAVLRNQMIDEPTPQASQAGFDFTTGPSGTAVISYTHYVPTSDGGVEAQLMMAECEDVRCAVPEAGTMLTSPAPNDHSLVFTKDGRPFAAGEGNFKTSLAVCADPACSEGAEPGLIEDLKSGGWPHKVAAAPDGSLYVFSEYLVTEGTGGIQVARCEGPECAFPQVRTLHELPALTYAPFDADLDDDGVPTIVWTTSEGFEYAECTTTFCDEVAVTATGIPAKALNIETAPDGHSIVAGINPEGVYIVPIDHP